ncbi:MAG: DUF1614 domain-containing protein [Methanomicrobia archaeon]|nr:DUF1614 domain-containing protein [Methanomicrobia archaeon]
MRRIVNEPDLKLFVFYGLLLIPAFFLCYESNIPFFFVVAAMLLTSVIEIPVYKTRTKKPEYRELEAVCIGEFYGVSISEEMQKGNERMYKTSVTLNVGGFIIPLFFAFYLLLSYPALLLEVAMSVLLMMLFSYMLSEVKGGVGIVIPGYVGIFAIPLGLILAAPLELPLENVAGLLIFVPAIFGILMGMLIRLATLRKEEEVGSAFFNIGGIGSFQSIFLISLLALLIGTVA